ncbi:MAG: type II toxin-antitoxin system HicA family toxin [Nanoarchaeota archaeon]
MKLRNINSKKVVRAFQKMGLKVVHQAGTHVILKGIINGQQKTISIPVHHKEIPPGTLTDIINNQACISREQFFQYY